MIGTDLDEDDKADPLIEDVVLLGVEVGVMGPYARGNLSIVTKGLEMLQFLNSRRSPLDDNY